jgi:hypothetical protein
MLCKRQEAVINDDVAYIQANAGGILLSFLSSTLFPSKGASPSTGNKNTIKEDSKLPASSSLSFADIMPFAKSILPITWDIARPILISWGVKRIASTILNSILKKKN